MPEATLTISSRNYSSWSLRGWLLCKMTGLDFEVTPLPSDDAAARAELLLLSPSFLVPCLYHKGLTIWDTLAIAEYLNEIEPAAAMLPRDSGARARCRSISGEMHSGFSSLRSALPMNLKAQHRQVKIWQGAQADIDRITAIWRECLGTFGGPYLFGDYTVADAMYAPVVTRFATYGVELDAVSRAYCARITARPEMQEWTAAARAEADDVIELEVEF